MKRTLLVLCLVAALSLVFASSAFANFGPHGGYITDTDSCAGCHRAHTSFSTLTYTPSVGGGLGGTQPSALLVGSATTMSEFCEACHGNTAPGASTNVVNGTFDSGPSGDSTILSTGGSSQGSPAVTVAYLTNSTFGAPLNGGGFSQMANLQDWETNAGTAYRAVTSAHSMEKVGVLWGAGDASDQTVTMTCTNCHDPHGSSNYRLLNDVVNGHRVGGYNPDDTPTGIVFSTETGYPTGDGGWLKHQAGQDQMALYRPDYTSGSAQIAAGAPGDSMSAWCSACHEQYDSTTGETAWAKDATNLVNKFSVSGATNPAGTYNYGAYEGSAAGNVGAQVRHRHPVDIPLQAGDGNLKIPAGQNSQDPRIPLEVTGAGGRLNQIGCLTCHYAHGSDSQMSGWAMAHLDKNAANTWIPVRDSVAGVEPDKADVAAIGAQVGVPGTSALLRANNRGVCERCHNK